MKHMANQTNPSFVDYDEIERDEDGIRMGMIWIIIIITTTIMAMKIIPLLPDISWLQDY